MILGLITLLAALSISAIAAYYSIVGLTAIFAAAVTPIIIMGVVLEMGKVVTTLWLHYNWERAEWKIKTYLMFAVGILMLITSMGIFGFLSKAHLEQAVPSGDIQAQVSLFDEKIKTQRDNIDSSRKALTQMDSAVDQMMSRTTDDTGATKSANLRRAQQKERGNLQKDIDTAQKEITKLQEQRAPIASQFRKVEAEVGPIKYIAALIYGDKADQNMLEAAVRWVIIIIVLVFDPLAIILILAATTSLDWAKNDRAAKKLVDTEKATALVQKSEEELKIAIEHAIELTRAEIETEHEHTKLSEWNKFAEIAAQATNEANAKVHAKEKERSKLADEVAGVTQALTHMVDQSQDLTSMVVILEEDVAKSITKQESLQTDLHTVIKEYDELLNQKSDVEAALVEAKNDLTLVAEIAAKADSLEEQLVTVYSEMDRLKAELALRDVVVDVPGIPAGFEDTVVPEEETAPTIADINEILEHTPPIEPRNTLPLMPVKHEVFLPSLAATTDSFPLGGNASFGIQFPQNPIKGDLFLRVDQSPNTLYKWSGTSWFAVNKDSSEAYVYDEEYIKLLVTQVSNGEIDIDDLSTAEQDQIAEFLRKPTSPTL